MWFKIIIGWIAFSVVYTIGYGIYRLFRPLFRRNKQKSDCAVHIQQTPPTIHIQQTTPTVIYSQHISSHVSHYSSLDCKPPIITPPPTTEPTPAPASKDKPRDAKYEPISITSDMVFKWQPVDDNECQLIFYPNELLESLDFRLERDYFKYRENRVYEIDNPTSDEDTLHGLYIWAEREKYDYKPTKYVHLNTPEQYRGINGVFKFNENLQYPYKVRKDDLLITLYFREKADIKRLEQKQLDEIAEAKREQEAFEQEKAEIAARIKEKHRKRELEKIVRQELIDSGELYGEQTKRPRIPKEVVDAVYKRDGGRCVECGSVENLQLDHIIPFSRGGATNVENLQLLCQKCNLAKSNKIG